MVGSVGKGDAAEQGTPQPRCIVWLTPDRTSQASPRPLLRGLARRRVAVVLAHDAPSVMRELAAAATQVVIVAEPRDQPRLGELCAAVRKYHPRARLWQYQARGPAGRPWLERMNHHDAASQTTTANASAASSIATQPPTPQSTAQHGQPTASPRPVHTTDRPTRRAPSAPLSSLTAEELAMLLGPEEQDRTGDDSGERNHCPTAADRDGADEHEQREHVNGDPRSNQSPHPTPHAAPDTRQHHESDA